MKIVVIGGSGLIGSKLVAKLKAQGHQAIAASPSSGVNTLTGEGLAEVTKGADVLVDVSNSPSFAEPAVMDFFKTSTANLLAAEKAAGVRHHVALSVVGTERLLDSPYFRAKIVQEKMIEESSIPYTIVRATQFFEFVKSIAAGAETDTAGHLHATTALIQPMAADDVAAAVCQAALNEPVNGMREIAGPQPYRMDELLRIFLRHTNDPREVIADPGASYFGSPLQERTLVPDAGAHLGPTRFENWLQPLTATAH